MPKFTLTEGIPAVEPKKITVAGQTVYVYGLNSQGIVPKAPGGPLVLALIAHPRTLDYKYAGIVASELLHRVPGLVCAAFDLPNHGSRIVSKTANEDWAGGNNTHGPDLVSVIDAAALEMSLVARHLPAYIPDLEEAAEDSNLVKVAIGISLGGHSVWRIAVDPYLRSEFAGIIPVVGSPDLQKLLEDRRASQCPNLSGPGLSESTVGTLKVWNGRSDLYKLNEFKILALCGGQDTLVPAKYTEEWIGGVIHPDSHKLIVEKEAGHAYTPTMIEHTADWLNALRSHY